MGDVGSEKKNGVLLDRKESSEIIDQLGHKTVPLRSTSQQWQGKSDKPVKKEARLFHRDCHQGSPTCGRFAKEYKTHAILEL